MRKGIAKLIIFTVVGSVFLILTACNSEQGAGSSESPERLAIGTASTGGAFFPLGTGIAELVSDGLESIEMNAESTGGSVDNVGLVNDGETEFALADMSVAYTAFEGIEDFDTSYSNLRGVAMGYGQMLQIVVHEDSEIEAPMDLKGKNISIGPAGSGTANTSMALLEALGISDEVQVEHLTHEQESQALGDRRIDAATFVIGLPAAAVTEFMTTHEGRIIPIDNEIVEQIRGEYPYYVSIPIPAGTYPGQDEVISSFGSRVALIANSELNEDTVYQVTQAFLENVSELESYHPSGKDFTFDDALDGMNIPLHEGAIKYYEEQEHPGLNNN